MYGIAAVALDGVVTVVAVFVVSVAAVDGVDVDVVAGGPWWVVVFGHPNSGARGDARNLVANDHGQQLPPEVVLVQHDLKLRSCEHDRPLKW